MITNRRESERGFSSWEEILEKVCIFGTGKKYETWKPDFRTDIEIIGLFDNDPKKWGKCLDGIEIYSPKELLSFNYDWIYILCDRYFEIRRQLSDLGIPENLIYDVTRKEKILKSEGIKRYGYLIEDNTERNKVLVVSNTLNLTGAPMALLGIVTVLIKDGYSVRVYSAEDGDLRANFLALGVEVFVSRDIISQDETWRELVKWADSVFVNTLPMYYLVEDLLKYEKRIMWWIHEFPLERWIDKFTYGRIESSGNAKIYGVSNKVKSLFEQVLDATKMDVLLLGVEDKKGKLKRHLPVNVGIIGYLSDEIKGIDVFADGAVKVNEVCGSNVTFSLVGSGELSDNVKNKFQKMTNVTVVGEVPKKQMGDIYNSLDVVVCASRIDSLPTVIIEALMYEKVVIVSSAAGMSEYISDGVNGLVFESENSDELRDKILWVIDNREKAKDLAFNGRKLYEKKFAFATFEKKLRGILREWVV